MPQYHTPDEDFISELLGDETYEHLNIPLLNLSAILGDTRAQIPRSTSRIVRSNMSVRPPGVLDSIDEQDLKKPTEYDSLLGEDVFYSEMQHSSFLVYNNIGKNTISGEDNNSSPLLRFSNTPDNEKSAICFIYVCCLDLYKQMLRFEEMGRIDLTKQDLRKIDSNIRWVSARLTSNSQYEILTVLRELQRIVMYITTLDFLFEG